MKIINPTDKDISVQIKGVKYTVAAYGELNDVRREHAEYWQTMLHPFLKVEEDNFAENPKKPEKKVVKEKVKAK